MERNSLEYLDLNLGKLELKKTDEGICIWCGIEESKSSYIRNNLIKNPKFKHVLHTNDGQLNCIVDLLSIVVHNQSIISKNVSNIISLQVKHRDEEIKEIRKIRENLDYIKENSLVESMKNLPNKKEIRQLIANLEPRKIELETKQILEKTRKELEDSITIMEQSKVTQESIMKYCSALLGKEL